VPDLIQNDWNLHHSPSGPEISGPDHENVPAGDLRHKLTDGYRVVKTSVMGRLHHEYKLVKEAA